jgi:hypothetical protein
MYKTLALVLFFSNTVLGQVSLTPKFGFEYSGIAYHSNGATRYKDIKISTPDGEMFLALEAGFQHKNDKFSLLIERMNVGESVSIIRDSVFYTDGFVGYGTTRKLTGRNILYLGLQYDKLKKITNNQHLSFFYGVGIGIGFNRTATYYREVQNAGYSSLYAGGENIVSIQRWAKPTGHGVFIKLRGGFSLINKKKREAVILELFWRQGFRKMIEYTVDYSYSSTLRPSYGRSVTGYRFNNRGTTFGTTIGFPINLSKHQSRKKK